MIGINFFLNECERLEYWTYMGNVKFHTIWGKVLGVKKILEYVLKSWRLQVQIFIKFYINIT